MNTLAQGVSVIICSYNRADIFLNLYRSFISDVVVREFILINDNSTVSYDNLNNDVSTYCHNRGIIYKYFINKARIGAPGCRNIGLKNVTSEYVFFSDDDMFLQPRGITALYEVIRLRNVQAVGARVYYLNEIEWNSKANFCDYSDKVEVTSKLIDETTLIGNFNKKSCPAIVDVDFVYQTVLYNNSFLINNSIRFFEGYKGNGYREETDPQIQIKEKGGSILFCSDVVCFHLPYEFLMNSGQYRGAKIWYEFWTLVNNCLFYFRHKVYFKKRFGLCFLKYLINFFLWKTKKALSRCVL